jgi:hypothetical protein
MSTDLVIFQSDPVEFYPGAFDLIGITLKENYYIDKCMPMGCSISCATFEKFSTFLHLK